MASLIPFVQARFRVSFFTQRTATELWKTATSVTSAGRKKGRAKVRQRIVPIERVYQIGSSPLNVQYPGLNSKAIISEEPMRLIRETSVERETKMNAMRAFVGEMKDRKKRFLQEDRHLHPLHRGFSGRQLVGMKLGPPPAIGGVSFSDFETYCLMLRRISNMTSRGRDSRSEALVVTGNGAGVAGYAIGESSSRRPMLAIVKAMAKAARALVWIQLHEERTIYHNLYAECENTRVFAYRREKGEGLTCHARLEKICEVLGIEDLYVKVEGSTKNYIALTKAFFTGLQHQETFQQIAERCRLHVVELCPSRQYFPRIVASPLNVPLKKSNEITDKERLELELLLSEGRQPLMKRRPPPFYANAPGHLAAEARKHKFRNQRNVMVRLLADGAVPRWTRDARRAWAEEKTQRYTSGVDPMPGGGVGRSHIGLSHVVANKKNQQ